MPTLVGIRLKPLDRLQYFDAGDLDLSVGERVIVETGEGRQEGTVIVAAGQVLYSDLRGPLDSVLRKAYG